MWINKSDEDMLRYLGKTFDIPAAQVIRLALRELQMRVSMK